MNQEIFYNELQKLEELEVLNKNNFLNPENFKELKIYISEISYKMSNDIATHDEIKLFIASVYLSKRKILLDNDIAPFLVPDEIRNCKEFYMAIIFKACKDGWKILSNPTMEDIGIKFSRSHEDISEFLKVIKDEDICHVRANIIDFLGDYNEIRKAIYFPDYKIDFSRVSFLYNKTNLEDYAKLKDIHYDELDSLRKLLCVPEGAIGYYMTFIRSLDIIFTLLRAKNDKLNENDYEILSVLLDHHSFKDYSYSISREEISKDNEDQFREFSQYYFKLIDSKSKNVIVNRVEKILGNKVGENPNTMGFIFRNELLKFDGSKKFTKIVVDRSL